MNPQHPRVFVDKEDIGPHDNDIRPLSITIPTTSMAQSLSKMAARPPTENRDSDSENTSAHFTRQTIKLPRESMLGLRHLIDTVNSDIKSTGKSLYSKNRLDMLLNVRKTFCNVLSETIKPLDVQDDDACRCSWKSKKYCRLKR